VTKTVFLARGLPGAGKSTRVRQMVKDFIERGVTVQVCSSDDFFVCPGCKGYHWDREKLGFAHSWCRQRFETALQEGFEAVFVDNTNVTLRECGPYVRMADVYGYKVEILEPTTPWAFDVDELVRRNTHGVPKEGIERMLARWVRGVTPEMCRTDPDFTGKGRELTEDEKAAARVR
jgi:NEDD4-binding protein 2